MSKNLKQTIRLIAALLALALAVGGLAACTSDNAPEPSAQEIAEANEVSGNGGSTTVTQPTTAETTTTTTQTTTEQETTTEEAAVDGKAVFAANCAACHTLAAAGASGAVGPNLDDLKPDQATVQGKVENGGGSMPAFKGQLSDAEIAAVAAYVAENAGS